MVTCSHTTWYPSQNNQSLTQSNSVFRLTEWMSHTQGCHGYHCCYGCPVVMVAEFPQKTNDRLSYNAQLNSWFMSEVTPVLLLGCEYYIRPVVWRASFLVMIIISDKCCFKSRSLDWDTQIGPKPASQRLWKTVEIRKTAKTVNSIIVHEETLEVYLQVLNVNSSSYAVDSQGCILNLSKTQFILNYTYLIFKNRASYI
jgi:hypothetical protein